ncbi:MAG TPA: hypothetical protein VGD08_26655 [Stellaceae bacterium]|jgi:hypothetical protein
MTRRYPYCLFPLTFIAIAAVLPACSEEKKPAEPTLIDLGALEACTAAQEDAFVRDCVGQVARVEMIVAGSAAADDASASVPRTYRLEGRARHGVLGIVASGPGITSALAERSAATVIGRIARRSGADGAAGGTRLVLDAARVAEATPYLGPRSPEEAKATVPLADDAAEQLRADAAELGRHSGRAVACGWLQWSSDLREVRDLIADYPTDQRASMLSRTQAEQVRVAFETAESNEYNRLRAKTAFCTAEYDMGTELAVLDVERDRRLLYKARIESDAAAADEAAIALDAAEKRQSELDAKRGAAVPPKS